MIHVYFLQPTNGGPVKIGCSRNVDVRHKNLEKKYRKNLILLATIEGGREKEDEIHEKFAHLRFGRTEQFRPALDLMTFIGHPLLASPNPDAVEVMPGNFDCLKTIGVRATAEWADWLDQLAKHCRTDVAKVIDLALARHAKAEGFDKPPPERIP